MQPLSNEERETCLNLSADDRTVWEVFSDDPVMQRKIESIGAMPVRAASDGIGKFYRLPASQISFRRPSALNAQQRADRAARARANFGKAEPISAP